MKKVEFIRTTSALDWSGNIRRESIFTPQGWEGFEDSWHKHQWLKQHFGQEVSTVGPHMWELLTERHSVMILEENDGVYRERHPTDWYDCAHCDAGYPDQECTCKTT